MRHTRIIRICMTLLLLTCIEAQAQRKTDVITLYNGDQITGEIISLFGGMLEVSTDAMGRVRIEWPEIASIQSSYHYELRISNGERLYGSFAEAGRPGQVVLNDIFGRHELESLEVVEIRSIEESFLDRIEIYLSGTYGYTKASDLTQFALNTEISYEDEKSRNTLTARTDITDTDSDRTSSTRVDLRRSMWRDDRPDAFRTSYVNYEDNDELALDYRVGVGAGLGRHVIDTHNSRMTASGGLQVITERALEGDSNQDVESFLRVTYTTWKFTSPELNLDFNFSLYPSLTDLGRLRSDSNLRLRWELIKDLSWDVTAWATSDNQVDDRDSYWDYAITTGIGWEY